MEAPFSSFSCRRRSTLDLSADSIALRSSGDGPASDVTEGASPGGAAVGKVRDRVAVRTTDRRQRARGMFHPTSMILGCLDGAKAIAEPAVCPLEGDAVSREASVLAAEELDPLL